MTKDIETDKPHRLVYDLIAAVKFYAHPPVPTAQPKEPEQEPVAWGVIASNTGKMCQVELDYDEVSEINSKWLVPLYTALPQRAWVNLTAEEIEDIRMQYHIADGVVRAGYERAVEAKLKEKNT